MLQSLKNFSKGTKIGISAGAGALVVLLAALGIWQPWKQEAPPDGGQDGQGTVLPPPASQDEEPEQVTLRVGNDNIPCTVYEGDGWELYVPEGWSADASGGGTVRFASPEGAEIRVWRAEATETEPVLEGTYAAIHTAGGQRSRTFYTGDAESCWSVTCTAPEEDWSAYDALFRAIGRTGELEGARPFQAWSPMPSEPDWQDVDGDAVLFLDKDGVPLDTQAEQAIRTRMLSWPDEQKSAFTGKYDFQLDWCASYVKLGSYLFVDVFCTQVSYGLKAGREGDIAPAEGQEIRDGWLYEAETLYVAVAHDGSRTEGTAALWIAGAAPGDVAFVRQIQDALG